MWKAYRYETIGRNHALEGIPCQDKTAMLFNWEYGPSLGTSDPRIESNMKRGKIYANKYAYFF